MCAVSGTLDYFRTHVPIDTWQPDTWSQLREILVKLDQLDRKLDQPECEDPTKAEWMKQVEERLHALESK